MIRKLMRKLVDDLVVAVNCLRTLLRLEVVAALVMATIVARLHHFTPYAERRKWPSETSFVYSNAGGVMCDRLGSPIKQI